jgi:hypothetical protein
MRTTLILFFNLCLFSLVSLSEPTVLSEKPGIAVCPGKAKRTVESIVKKPTALADPIPDGADLAKSIAENWVNKVIPGLTEIQSRVRIQGLVEFVISLNLPAVNKFYPTVLKEINQLIADSGKNTTDEFNEKLLLYFLDLETKVNKVLTANSNWSVKIDPVATPTETLNSVLQTSGDQLLELIQPDVSYSFQFLRPDHGYGDESLFLLVKPRVWEFFSSRTSKEDDARAFLSAFIVGPKRQKIGGRGLKKVNSHNGFDFEISLPIRDTRIAVDYDPATRTFTLLEVFTHKDI